MDTKVIAHTYRSGLKLVMLFSAMFMFFPLVSCVEKKETGTIILLQLTAEEQEKLNEKLDQFMENYKSSYEMKLDRIARTGHQISLTLSRQAVDCKQDVFFLKRTLEKYAKLDQKIAEIDALERSIQNTIRLEQELRKK